MDGEESRQLPLSAAVDAGAWPWCRALSEVWSALIHKLLCAGHAVVHYDANIFTVPAPQGSLTPNRLPRDS